MATNPSPYPDRAVKYRRPGDIKEMKALRLCMEVSGASSAVAIMDKGIPSKASLKLSDDSNEYIASLCRILISMQVSHIIRGHLRRGNKPAKYSPMQMVRRLSRIRTVHVSGQRNICELTRKGYGLLAQAGWDIM